MKKTISLPSTTFLYLSLGVIGAFVLIILVLIFKDEIKSVDVDQNTKVKVELSK